MSHGVWWLCGRKGKLDRSVQYLDEDISARLEEVQFDVDKSLSSHGWLWTSDVDILYNICISTVTFMQSEWLAPCTRIEQKRSHVQQFKHQNCRTKVSSQPLIYSSL